MEKGSWLFFFLAVLIPLAGQSQYVRESKNAGKVHGKFFERIVPGITFQAQTKNRGGLDLNPLLGYRLTSKLTAGIGWNERLGFHFRHNFGVSHRRGVYGPRSFVDYKLLKGFSIRGEVEKMNTFVPPLLGITPAGALGSTQWVWGVFVGIKKDFRITAGWHANIQVLYNLVDNVYDKSPYSDRLNLRIGFDFPSKRRQ